MIFFRAGLVPGPAGWPPAGSSTRRQALAIIGRMVLVRFSDAQSERRGLGYLAGRFPFKSWESGQTLVPESALPHLAVQGIRFQVEGQPTYEQCLPAVRGPAPAKV